jgi:pimeloyl-ACP methyl ester carboxylesterase
MDIGSRRHKGRQHRVAAAGLWTALALVVGAAGVAEPAGEPRPTIVQGIGAEGALFLPEAAAGSRLTIVGDHADGIYALGQSIHWRVEPGSPSRFGQASYTLKKGGLDLLREGKLELASTVEEIDATLPAPSTLLLEVKATDGEGKAVRALAGAVIAPERIQPSAPRPADFDQFWQAKLEELAKIPARPQLVSLQGISQGGLQALVTAGLHPKVSAAIAGVPAGCGLTGPQAGRSPGWPAWCWKTQGKDPAKVIEAGHYYDVVNFASRIKCPVLVGVGLVDETCPPAGIFAALNQIKGPKEMVVLPHGDHSGSANSHQAFNDRSRAWQEELRRDKPAPVMGGH